MIAISHFDPVVRLFWEGACRGSWHEGPRRIYDCLLDYVSDGEYVLTLGDETRVYKTGDLIIVPPGIRSEGSLTPRRYVHRHCIHFSWNSDFAGRHPPLQTAAEERFKTELSHAVPPAIARHLPLTTLAPRGSFLHEQMAHLLQALRKQHEHAPLLLWPVLRCMLAEQQRPSAAASTRPAAGAIMDIKSFIETHYFEEIGYGDFCERSGLSQSYLCELFQSIVGVPPTQYLNDVRLQQARRLIREERLSIKEVAATVGIRDANYFARLFRQRFGITPTAYRAER
jgi:AraC-like DNA-binding protein